MSISKNLGKYEILEEIGRGANAVVYKARDTVLERIVALKVIRPQLLWEPKNVERFLREAKAAAKLEHPHIVTIYEVGEEEGSYYISMQYLPGPNLEELIERGPMEVERAVELAIQVAEALGYAHQQGFIHRDVKPSNILLSKTGQAVLTDFGIVKALAWASLTSSGGAMGTPAYVAPEIWDGEEPTPATDVYSLAVVLWEMLAGKHLFEGETPSAVMKKHLMETPPKLKEVRPEVSEEVANVVARALAKPMKERYPDGEAFGEALREAIKGRVVTLPTAEITAALPEEAPPTLMAALRREVVKKVFTLSERLAETKSKEEALEMAKENVERLFNMVDCEGSNMRKFCEQLEIPWLLKVLCKKNALVFQVERDKFLGKEILYRGEANLTVMIGGERFMVARLIEWLKPSIESWLAESWDHRVYSGKRKRMPEWLEIFTSIEEKHEHASGGEWWRVKPPQVREYTKSCRFVGDISTDEMESEVPFVYTKIIAQYGVDAPISYSSKAHRPALFGRERSYLDITVSGERSLVAKFLWELRGRLEPYIRRAGVIKEFDPKWWKIPEVEYDEEGPFMSYKKLDLTDYKKFHT